MPQAQETVNSTVVMFPLEHLSPHTSGEILDMPLAHFVFIGMGNPCSMSVYTHTFTSTHPHQQPSIQQLEYFTTSLGVLSSLGTQ